MIDNGVKPYIYIMYPERKVYNRNLVCIGKGIERALKYQEKHRVPIAIMGYDEYSGKQLIMDILRPKEKALKEE